MRAGYKVMMRIDMLWENHLNDGAIQERTL